MSRRHLHITMDGGRIRLTDLASTNGTVVDAAVAPGVIHDLQDAPIVRIGDSLIQIGRGAPPPADTADIAGHVVVRPVARGPAPEEPGQPALPPATPFVTRNGVPWVAALVPSLAAGGLAWFTHSPLLLLFALLSPVTMLSTAAAERMGRLRRLSKRRLQSRIDRERVGNALSDERLARRRELPDPAAVESLAVLPADGVWGAPQGDLRVRVGTASAASRLQVRSADGPAPTDVLADVPAAVDLADADVTIDAPRVVGLAVLRWLVCQLAVGHPPGRLELALVLADVTEPSWQWARWLPHLRHPPALTAQQRNALHERLGCPSSVDPGSPTLAVICDLPPGTAVPWPSLGLVVGTSPAKSGPVTSRAVTAITAVGNGNRLRIGGSGSADNSRCVVADQVSHGWAERVARGLAPLSTPQTGRRGVMPDRCPLPDLLGAAACTPEGIARAWRRSDGRATFVLGADADGPVVVDLDREGPHVLVGGTTGSGKSELLRTLVLASAAAHPPDEISFVLIDYKGGAAFADCLGLPHVAGVLTDLDPHLTRRALIALDAELRRREAMLARAGAADLTRFRAGGGTGLARLVIVVDEFAALADDAEGFVDGLVSVAARGRSLGVHLVLATQRPGSAITADIRANAGLRIALRVQDGVESREIIDGAEAAAIDAATPGRAWLRETAGLREVQTAVVVPARAATTEIGVEILRPWRRRAAEPVAAPLGADPLITAIRAAAAATDSPAAAAPWLPPLPTEVLGVDDDECSPWQLPIGLVDLPLLQRQQPLCIDLAESAGWLIVGAPGSGRSTVLATTLASLTGRLAGRDVAVHVVDPAGTLAAQARSCPQLSTYLGADGVDRVELLLRRLRDRADTGPTPPGRTVLAIDDWDRLLGRHDDIDASVLTDELLDVLRVARGTGLTCLIAGGRTLLGQRFAASVEHRLLLRLADPGDYLLAGVPVATRPEVSPPGRGVRVEDGAEFQIAVPAPPGRPAAPGPIAVGAVGISALPRSVRLDDLPRAGGIVLGRGGDDAAPYRIDPVSGFGRWLVIGPARSGRSTALITVLTECRRLGLATVVAAPPSSPLYRAARAYGLDVLGPHTELTGAWLDRRASPADPPLLLLVDDSGAFASTGIGDALADLLRNDHTARAVIAGSGEDFATAYRGLTAEARRARRGLVLWPGPGDGDLVGARLPRAGSTRPPGRGYLVAMPDPRGPLGEPVAIQIAWTDLTDPTHSMWR